jgi:hypothetical protein
MLGLFAEPRAGTGAVRPYPRSVGPATMTTMQLDFASVALALAGIAAAAVFAVLAGWMSARVFFDASRENDGEP